jgi:hypothetical protein
VGVVGGRSPAGRHTRFDVVGEEVPSLKGLGDLITCLPSTHVMGYDCDALRAEDCPAPTLSQKRGFSLVDAKGPTQPKEG